MCVYMCIYTNTPNTYIYKHTHTHTGTQAHIHMHVCNVPCINEQVYVHLMCILFMQIYICMMWDVGILK